MESTTTYDTSSYATATPQVDGAVTAMLMFWTIFAVAITVVAIVAMWKMFTKAGKPGWASIVPIYNVYVMLQIIGRPGWWLLLFFIPFVNIVIAVVIALDTAKAFGKDALFGILGNFLFSPIGYLIIGFGKSQYVGPVAAQATPAQPAAPTQPTPPQTPPTTQL